MGLGTFGSDAVTGDQIAAAVLDAASVGYRHFDCAVGLRQRAPDRAVAEEDRGGRRAARGFLGHVEGLERPAQGEWRHPCEKSLRDLQLDYLDRYLVHWPFPNFHPPGCAPDYHNPDARAYIHEEFMATWAQMEQLSGTRPRAAHRHVERDDSRS